MLFPATVRTPTGKHKIAYRPFAAAGLWIYGIATLLLLSLVAELCFAPVVFILSVLEGAVLFRCSCSTLRARELER